MSGILDKAKAASQVKSFGAFRVELSHEAMRRAALEPDPKAYMGKLVREDDLVFIFGQAAAGKSSFVMQWLLAITRGQSVFDELPNEAGALLAGVIDFEMRDKDVQKRLGDIGLIENNNLLRITPDFDFEIHGETTDAYLDSIETILETIPEMKVLVIDNLTTLVPKFEKSADISPVVTRLNRMKRQYNVAIVVLAHTPKMKQGQAVNKWHMQGSASIVNLADSQVALVSSETMHEAIYLKDTKPRHDQTKFKDRVLTLTRKAESDGSFRYLFESEEYFEADHLIQEGQAKMTKDLHDQILEELEKGTALRAIAKKLDVTVHQVRKVKDSH